MTRTETIAAAIANARGGRRGVPPITNVLDALPPRLRDEVMDDAAAVERALADGLDALAFLQRASPSGGRIVSSGCLTVHQIADARAGGRFFVGPDGRGWALLPWNLTTGFDEARNEAAKADGSE